MKVSPLIREKQRQQRKHIKMIQYQGRAVVHQPVVIIQRMGEVQSGIQKLQCWKQLEHLALYYSGERKILYAHRKIRAA